MAVRYLTVFKIFLCIQIYRAKLQVMWERAGLPDIRSGLKVDGRHKLGQFLSHQIIVPLPVGAVVEVEAPLCHQLISEQ